MGKKIKYWCIYKGIPYFPFGIGKIVEEFDSTVGVEYVESKRPTPEYWAKKGLLRFKTLDGAIRKFSKLSGVSLSKIKESMAENFPSQKNKILKIRD